MDCWGLVRDALHRLYGKPLVESHSDVSPADKAGLTQRYKTVAEQFTAVAEPKPGDVAAGIRRGLCIHIGIAVEADGRFMILHTGRKHGPTLSRVEDFARQFGKVSWWRYAGN